MEKEAIVEVKDVKRYYGKGENLTKALDGVSFKVYKGEFLGIMGPSGSGKSTLLHILGLLDEPTGGKVIIGGVDTEEMNKKTKAYFRLKKLGYVFQQYRLIPELNALENIALPCMMHTYNSEKCFTKAKEMLNKIGLGGRHSHHPFELSGGEQQRVAIARALSLSPEILFADEPTANLDTVAGEQVLKIFKMFNKKYNQTIIMVSHEPEHKKYFDRIIKIKDGKIEEIVEKKKGKKESNTKK